MRKILLSLAAMLVMGLTLSHAEKMNIGYAESSNSGTGVMGPGAGDNPWIEMAIYLPATTVNALAGNTMTGVTGAISAPGGIDNLRVWVRTELEGENIAEGEWGEDNMSKAGRGYNEISFATPWQIPENFGKGVYVGFGMKADLWSNPGKLCAFSRSLPGAYFFRQASGVWRDYSDRGVACIDAIIEGDNLPDVNLRISDVSSATHYVKSKKDFVSEFKIHNFGTKEVTKFDIKASYSDGTTVTKTVEKSIKPNKMLTVEVDFAPELNLAGEQTVEYTIENIAEGTDVAPDDNKAQASFESILKDYPRYVLSEEFTTEMCGSCPDATKMIHELLQRPEYANIIQVAHHAGYKTDFLTTPFHEEYTWMWRFVGQDEAPLLSVDRKPVDLSGSMSFYPGYDYDVMPVWDARLKEVALVDVSIKWHYTDDTKSAIKVTVSGEKSVDKLCDFPSINLMVLEDGIQSRSQSGAGPSWKHDDVSRYVSAEDYWGDELTFNGDNYEYTCVIPLDQSWNRDELTLVAYVANHGEKRQDRAIMNAGRLKFDPETPNDDPVIDDPKEDEPGKDEPGTDDPGTDDPGKDEPGTDDPGTDDPGEDDAVGTISGADIVAVEYYDLTGNKVENPAKGIYIVKTIDVAGKVSTGKMVVK